MHVHLDIQFIELLLLQELVDMEALVDGHGGYGGGGRGGGGGRRRSLEVSQ